LKKAGKILIFIIFSIVCALSLYLIFMQMTDYNPKEKVTLDINNNQSVPLKTDFKYTLMTYNIGYCGLDDSQDFFMDGGRGSRSKSKEKTLENLTGIKSVISKYNPDLLLLQEVDTKSLRSFNIDEYQNLIDTFSNYGDTYAFNYKTNWVPVPLEKPMGYVNSTLVVMSKYNILNSTRYQYPGKEFWPKYLMDLDRCFDEAVISVENGKKLILVNSHLSAYDKGGVIRKQQLDYLSKYMKEQRDKGNYVIIGGDFNHVIPGSNPDNFKHKEPWPEWLQKLPADFKPEGYKWVYDANTPSVRTIAKNYVVGDNFLAVIDGFLVSDNIEIEDVKGIQTNFKFSDHNPVTVSIKLTNGK